MLLDYFSFGYAPSISRIAATENETRYCGRACLCQESGGHALEMCSCHCARYRAWFTQYSLKYEWTTVQWWNNRQVWKNVAQTRRWWWILSILRNRTTRWMTVNRSLRQRKIWYWFFFVCGFFIPKSFPQARDNSVVRNFMITFLSHRGLGDKIISNACCAAL